MWEDGVTYIISPKIFILPIYIASCTIFGYSNCVCLSVVSIQVTEWFYTPTNYRKLSLWYKLGFGDPLSSFDLCNFS